MEELTDKLTQDFKSDTARTVARSAAMSFHTKLTNGLAMSQTFDAVCKESNVPFQTLPAFTQTTRPPLEGLEEPFNLAMLQRTVDTMEVGGVSQFIPAGRDGGFILYFKGRSAADEVNMKERLSEFTSNLRQYRLSQAFDQWIRKQMETDRLVMPQSQADPEIPGGGPVPVPAPSSAPGAGS
jgi:hypothetical protein